MRGLIVGIPWHPFFQKMYEPRSGRTKTFIFITPDDLLVRKKLKVSIAAKEDKPRINIFEDDTFTVGETPIV